MRRSIPALLASLVVMLALAAPRALRAGDDPTLLPPPQPGRMSVYAEANLAPHGDARGRVEIHFAPEDWARVKASTPDPRRFLQDVHGSRSESEQSERVASSTVHGPTSRRVAAMATARITAAALARHSASSASGTESATMPAPACTWATPLLMTAVRMVIAMSRLPAKSTYPMHPP